MVFLFVLMHPLFNINRSRYFSDSSLLTFTKFASVVADHFGATGVSQIVRFIFP